ncbi:hypothetical protein NC652_033264 [Populus alba x Populus x berolinensis]|uniref:Uncharacterized protein n=1 Tax=Populus alba x Populus x berolinensis TaxID=444605 RepID=A0AAD6LUC8_9ROSI|nr:hypothetical protein NC652_033264 [Populus alba x Populus x berolinensis]KAJ6972839.1 hypothetical protein NC653_033225 [Populus alba x Populus x berolinensis]
MGPCGPPTNPRFRIQIASETSALGVREDTKSKSHAGYRLSFLQNLRNKLRSAVQLRLLAK